jgi:hypothetical protein
MKTKTSALMAVLTLTAIVLGAILLATPSKEAKGEMLNEKTNYTMMMVGGAQGGEEFLMIVDKKTQKMLAYRMQGATIELATGANFGTWFGTQPVAPGARGR